VRNEEIPRLAVRAMKTRGRLDEMGFLVSFLIILEFENVIEL
jgi:hypothetical protein